MGRGRPFSRIYSIYLIKLDKNVKIWYKIKAHYGSDPSMSRFNRFALVFLSTALLLGVSGCNGMPKSERKIFNEMRYTVHVYSVYNKGDKRKWEYMDIKQEDLGYICKSKQKFTKLCHIVSMLPAGNPNFIANYIRVYPDDIVVPGYSSFSHTMENGRDTVLLLPRPTQ